MKKTLIAIRILEMTQTGLQEVVEFETERLEDPEKQREAIGQITEMIFKNESMYLQLEDQAFILKGLPKKTIVIKGKFQLESGEYKS